ncbi:MAG: TonB-dependent receptor [Bacteroidales bacterium]|nr:TonB-dependent receptor [Bacteroidales bacterium]
MKSDRIAAVAALLALLSPGISFGQDLATPVDTLKEAVVTSLKIERLIEETPANLNIVTSLDVKQHSSFTVADVLKFEPGLAIGGDGVWATNINVRGLSENRLVTLVDGNRIETATDLTASLSMIDVNDIERVEVIKGAQSSLYGSGAMGGIVNIITKDGYFADDTYFHGNLTGSFSSVNKGHSEYLSVNAGGSRWYLKLNGTYGHANDIMTPKGLLPNSGFTTTNLGARAGFKPAKNQILKFEFQRNWSTDVGIPGGAAFAASATATYKNIGRTLFNGSYEILDLNETWKSLKFTGFSQNIIRDVEMIPNTPKPQAGAWPEKVTPLGKHHTYGGNIQGTWEFGDDNTLVAGVDAWRRDISSDRNKYIKQFAAGEVKAEMIRNEKPFPAASYTSAGFFAQDESRFLDDRLIVRLGARLDGNFVKNEEGHNVEYIDNVTTGAHNDNPPGKIVTFEAGKKREFSWSGNLGAIYRLAPVADLVFNAARSYRSPSLEEYFKFIDLSGNKVRIGNVDLKPEDGLSADLGIRLHGERFSLEVSGFVNKINNMIVERKANTTGVNDTLILDNASKALLYGGDFNASFTIVRGLKVYALGAYTVGLETSKDNAWLPLIPPMNGTVGVAYNYPKVGGINLSAFFAGAKKEGNMAASDTATDSYYRLDLSLSTRPFHFGPCALQLFGGIDNLTNAEYRNFLSTNRNAISCEPGRNFYIRASLSF